jgi:hypothetical protein
MSCDNSTYCIAIVDLDPRSSLREGARDCVTAKKTDIRTDKSLKRDQPGRNTERSGSRESRHSAHSRTIPDSTKTDPEYVWGDEGPINDRSGLPGQSSTDSGRSRR